MSLSYWVAADQVIVEDDDGRQTVLSESDLVEMLSALQASAAYDPHPRTGAM